MTTFNDFRMGCEFRSREWWWRCTDIGSRTIVAIRLDMDHDPSWYEGPPYAIAEHVFDEDSIQDCLMAKPGETRPVDASGAARVVAGAGDRPNR